MTRPLSEAYLRKVAFDRSSCEKAAIGDRKIFYNHDTFQFMQGATYEADRTKPLHEAVAKLLDAVDLLTCSESITPHKCLCGACKPLAELRALVAGEGE